jgi:hypothetical protein
MVQDGTYSPGRNSYIRLTTEHTMGACLFAQGFRSRRDQDHPVHLILTLVVNGMSDRKCIE